MKIQTAFIVLLLGLIVLSCGKKENASNLIDVSTNFSRLHKKKYYYGDSIHLSLTSKYKIDSITVEVNGNKLSKRPFYIDSTFHFGINKAQLHVFYNQKKRSFKSDIKVYSTEREKKLPYKIIAKYPHDTNLFTEGFIYKNGIIYESTGLKGKSKIVKYKLGSKSFIKEKKLDPDYFGEGIALLSDSLYQLTWKERVIFLYDHDFNLVKKYDFPVGLDEGWGMTQNEQNFIISDGSSALKYISKQDLSSVKKKFYVVGNQTIYSNLNELEWTKNTLYSNVWQSNEILLIDPKTGVVKAKIDLTKLVKENKKDDESVLNGIAVKGNHLLITGKNWKYIYEIKILSSD